VVPRFEAFAGIRYDTGRIDLAEVSAPPYDVIDATTRELLADRHPNNVVHIDCPVVTEPSNGYRQAADRFRSWRDAGVLIDDAEPSLYLYRMAFTDDHGRARHTTGVIGAVGLEPHADGDVLAHEHTTPRARSDRLELLRVTGANLSPIWFLSLTAGLTKLLDPPGEPIAAWTDAGVGHSLWRLSDRDAIAAIEAAVGATPLVIADGHHRYETCLAYQTERRAAAGGSAGGYDLTLGFVVELVEDEIDIEPVHRLVSGLPAGTDLLSAFSAFFAIGPLEAAGPGVLDRMDGQSALALVLPDGVRLLRPRPDAFGPGDELDTSRVDTALAALPGHDLVFQPGWAEVLASVDHRRADAGVLVRPPTIGQIAEVAHRRHRMPPKTTYFWPKPRTGLVFRTLD
jgi:uncharacterized protein (DUF1015 family)